MKVYLVGGAVRDKALGLPVDEKDWVVVGATQAEMKRQGFKRVGKSFPVFLHPETQEEYALARKEIKVAPGYQGFDFDYTPEVTLEEDLIRRDLTINAIARSRNGRIIDPYHGMQDIKHRIMRHVSPAFVEDPVRILRVARLSAKLSNFNFEVAPETNQLMREMVANGEVDALVPERVWAECEKALQSTRPSFFFRILKGCGALERLFPEIFNLFGVPASPEWHPEIDTGNHVMLALDEAGRLGFAPEVKFAVLMHDLGKARTSKSKWPSHAGHEEIGVPLVEAFCQRWAVPNRYKDLAILVTRFHGHCHKAANLRANTIVKVLTAVDAFRKPERLQLFLQACEADARGRIGHETEPYPQAEIFQQAFATAKQVSAQQFIDQGYQGIEIAKKLYEARIDAVKKLL